MGKFGRRHQETMFFDSELDLSKIPPVAIPLGTGYTIEVREPGSQEPYAYIGGLTVDTNIRRPEFNKGNNITPSTVPLEIEAFSLIFPSTNIFTPVAHPEVGPVWLDRRATT